MTLPVECWQPIVSASQRQLDFMAKHGMKGIIGGGAATGGASDQVVAAWREAQARHGRETELGGNLIIGVATYIADTEEEAVKEARSYFEENLKMFGPLGFVRGMTQEQITAMGNRSTARSVVLPTIEEGLASGAWLCGPPERVTERLMELQDRFPGLDQVNIGCTVMSTTKDVILEQLELFGQEVMPAFKKQEDN